MEVLMQNNDFVMFLFSGVLQMAENILFWKQIKRDFLPCQNTQIWWNQEAEGEEPRNRAGGSASQSWPCYVPLVALEASFTALTSNSLSFEDLAR